MIDDEVDVFLEHFGVKGMKWGVRRERLKERIDSVDKKVLAKRVAIGAGALAVAIGTAYLAKNNYENVRLSSLSGGTVKTGAKAAAQIVSEPTSIIHAGRGRDKGYTFTKTGGVPSPLKEYETAGFTSSSTEMFRRYGKNNEKVAARFLDPDGRKDRAGRPIFHEVIVPSSMTSGMNSVADVVKRTWPHLRDDYSGFYDS